MTSNSDRYDADRTAEPPNSAPRFGRRKILAGLALGGAAAATPGLASALDGRRGRGDRDDRGPGPDGPDGVRTGPGGNGSGPDGDGPTRFGRVFDDHPPFAEPTDELREALTEIGRPGGMLDANDPLEVGPMRLITEPDLSPDNPDNPTHTAGATFMAQFIDHDITADAGSRLGRPQSVRRSVNTRTARLDLDSVYGGGPEESWELYEADDPLMFRIESGGWFVYGERGTDDRRRHR